VQFWDQKKCMCYCCSESPFCIWLLLCMQLWQFLGSREKRRIYTTHVSLPSPFAACLLENPQPEISGMYRSKTNLAELRERNLIQKQKLGTHLFSFSAQGVHTLGSRDSARWWWRWWWWDPSFIDDTVLVPQRIEDDTFFSKDSFWMMRSWCRQI
jgi:hypothetical protein